MVNTELERLSREAQVLLDAGRLSDAKKIYAQVCTLDPENAEAHFLIGTINAEQGLLDDAVMSLNRAISLQPDDPDAHYTLGSVLNAQGKPEESLLHAERAIALDPEFAEAWLLLGSTNALLGETDAAESGCTRAIDLGLNNYNAYFTLGDICRVKGDLEKASKYLSKAVNLNHGAANAWLLLGTVQALSKNYPDAESSLRQAIIYRPDNADTYKNLGNILKDQGRCEEAIPIYQRALELDTGNVDSLRGLGACYGLDATNTNVFNLDNSIYYLQKVVEICPGAVDGYYSLSRTLRMAMRFDDAEEVCKLAVKKFPDNPDIYNELGHVLFSKDGLDEALYSFNKALQISPENITAIAGTAAVYERKKQYDASLQKLHPFLDNSAPDYEIATGFANLSRHFNHHSESIGLLEKLLALGNLNLLQRSSVHFYLGVLYGSLEKFSDAFEHLQIGNELATVPYDLSRDKVFIESLITAYSDSAMMTLPRAENRSELPIFIVGMPRSGTSLVEQILAMHPLVFGAGELNNINDIVTHLTFSERFDQPYPENIRSLTQEYINELAQEYLQTLVDLGSDASIVTDKMPSNFLNLGLIELLFPNARIIHCIRDPMDTCFSCYCQNFVGNLPYANNLSHLGKYYNLYKKLMQHWKEVLKLPIMEVQYEELVRNPEKLTREMLEFCGLDWDERCLRFYESERIVKTSSYDQVRQPIYEKSIGRWKSYENYLEPLKEALNAQGV